MKLKTQSILICIFLVITTSCGTLNNSNLLSGRQGKNRVIDRDFEPAIASEEDVQTTESISSAEPSQSIADEEMEIEGKTETISPDPEKSIAHEKAFTESLNLDKNITEDDAVIEVQENIESETVVKTSAEKNSKPAGDGLKIIFIILLALVLTVIIIGVLILLFILSLF